MAIARAASQHADTRKLLVDWMAQHLVEVVEKYPGYTAGRLLSAVGKLCDRASLDAASKALTPIVKELGRGERRLREALENAEVCITLRERQAGAVSTYLRKRRW